MSELNKHPESQLKIRFGDCDPFNHLNNARYIDYMINAREDHLVDYYGFDPYQLASTEGLGWVTAQTQVSYFTPANLMETVTVQTRLLAATEKSLLLEALMWNAGKTTLKALMWVKLVHFDLRSQKSRAHSGSLMQFLKQIEAPLPLPASFEERVGQLRS